MIRERSEIPFWISNRTGGLPLIGAEIGVLTGEYSNHLLCHANFKTFYCIDAWKSLPDHIDISNVPDPIQELRFQEAKQRLSKFDNKVRLIRQKSTNAAKQIKDESLDFIYIDCNHRYEAVLKDLKAYYPKMKDGAVMAGHDYLDGMLNTGLYGVRQAVDEFISKINPKNFIVTDPQYDYGYPSWIIEL